MRNALGTLPWVEQATIQMDFKTRELKFRLKDKGQFSEPDIKSALKAQGFADAQVTSVPS